MVWLLKKVQLKQLKNSIDKTIKKNAVISISVDKTIIGGIKLKIEKPEIIKNTASVGIEIIKKRK